MSKSPVVPASRAAHPERPWRERVWFAACAAGLMTALWFGSAQRGEAGTRRESVSGSAQPEPKPVQPNGPFGWSMVVLQPGPPAGVEPGREAKGFSPTASFTLREGQSLDPSVPADGMAATLSAMVWVPDPGRYRFGAEAEGGSAHVFLFDLAGKPLGDVNAVGSQAMWTPWVDLRSGPVSVSVQFARSAGSARLRTLWEKQGTLDQGGFPAEAIPPAVVTPPKYTLGNVAAAQREFRGRVLLGELNCTGCHSAPPAQEAVLTARAAPYLGEVGRRAQPGWLLRWVSNPQAVKPGCDMPRVLGDGPADKADAESITQFLASLGGPADARMERAEPQKVGLGRRLYHTVGCVACHGALEAPVKVFGEGYPAEMPRTPAPAPFGDLAGKWRAGPLSDFLKDPLRTHPAGRMPSMLLQPVDAEAIAAYLVEQWGPGDGGGFVVDASKVEAGRAAFAARGCASCHQLGGTAGAVAPTLKATAFAQLKAGAGCLSPTDPGSPRYTLSDDDRADLAGAIAAVNRVIGSGKPAVAPLDEGRRMIAAYGCQRCHERDHEGGVAESIRTFFRTVDDTELGDEGRIPPRLDGVGAKLTPTWLRTVLTDGGRARKYMTARMPQFGKLNVGRVHLLLAAIDGAGAEPANPAKPNEEMILAGRRLVGDKGMNCISCHAYAGKTAGTAGPDITSFAQRLRPSWFQSYILAPGRYKPGTRMTAFYSGGVGPVQDVLGGDPRRQATALWAYFEAGSAAQPPEGLPSGSEGMPVAIGNRPVVFRAFMKDAGSRGIAVGYPAGIHFGFDATAVRLVDAWQGDFIDATASWGGRGGKIASGQGTTVWNAPAGPAVIIGSKPLQWPVATGADAGLRFKGYRLEKDGTPAFMYELSGPSSSESEGRSAQAVAVSEKFVPGLSPGVLIRRDFALTGVPSGQTVWVNAGKGSCHVKAADGIKFEQATGPDGETWFGLTGEAGNAMSFSVEIQP